MFRRGGFRLLLWLGLVLAGCETGAPVAHSPRTAPGGRVDTLPIPEAPVLIPARDAAAVHPSSTIVAPPAITAPVGSPSAAVAASEPVPYWVDWQTWLAEHGNPRAEVIPGSRRALWNGVPLYLGFEPRLMDHRIEVLRRDVEKNFVPLLGREPAVPLERRIVIDPGHGGTNSGTRMYTGSLFEKQLTLDWALRLAALLEARGWTVALTRTNDATLDLPARVDCADRAGAALFVRRPLVSYSRKIWRNLHRGIFSNCCLNTFMDLQRNKDYHGLVTLRY